MNDFDTLIAAQDDIHDGFYGEAWTVAAPAAADPADPQRRRPRQAAVRFTGIETTGHGPNRAHNAEGHAENTTRRVAAEKLAVDYRANALPFTVGKGFVVTREADGSAYEVAEVSFDGVSRSTMVLTAKTAARAAAAMPVKASGPG